MFTSSGGGETMDGKGLDFGSMGSGGGHEGTTTVGDKMSSSSNFFDDAVELKSSSGGGDVIGKDILPIDKDPWAETPTATSATTTTTTASTTSPDPNDLFASAPANAFENATASNKQTDDSGGTGGTDDQGWANFDKMNS